MVHYLIVSRTDPTPRPIFYIFRRTFSKICIFCKIGKFFNENSIMNIITIFISNLFKFCNYNRN